MGRNCEKEECIRVKDNFKVFGYVRSDVITGKRMEVADNLLRKDSMKIGTDVERKY